jgi:hypothetical protein
MTSTLRPLACLAALLALACSPSRAQDAPRRGVPEPAVQRTVIEDDSVRIEELRVRGQNQRISVQPKNGAAAYEVMPNDDTRGDGPRGTVGRRVWKMWSF